MSSSSSKLALVALAALLSKTYAQAQKLDYSKFTLATPGTIDDIIVTDQNTLNSTSPSNFVGGPKVKSDPPRSSSGSTLSRRGNPNLQVELISNLGSDTTVNAYIYGLTTPDNAMVFVKSDGTFFTPQCGGEVGVPQPIDGSQIAIPVSSSSYYITMPGYLSSGHVDYSVNGELVFNTVMNDQGVCTIVEPSPSNPSDMSADTYWGFAEFTNNDANLVVNPSSVTFAGTPVAIVVRDPNDNVIITHSLSKADGVAGLCSDLLDQSNKDGQPWSYECVYNKQGTLVRAVSPGIYMKNMTSAFSDYYTDYVSQVYNKYANQDLTLDLQGSGDNAICRTMQTDSGDVLNCGSESFAMPTAADIFGCNSGPFENSGSATRKAWGAILCAAFTRSTLLLDGGDHQPLIAPDQYYTVDPTNHYSQLVHANSPNGIGYAFAYDDVHDNSQTDTSGTITSNNVKLVSFIVGGI